MKRMTLPSRRRDFVQHGLEPLLELAAEFGAGDQRAHVERHQPLVAQRFGHVAIDDAQRQAFGDGGLADAGLADQHGIVLGAPRQHLDGAADFVVAADDRIELAGARQFGEVAGIFLERVIGVFGGRRIGGAALAQILDRRVEALGTGAGILEDARGIGALRHRQREQQHFGGDKGIAGLLGGLLRLLEQARAFGRQIDLAGAGALDLRNLGERGFGVLERLLGTAAGGADQARGKPLLIVEEHLQEMFGFELLMVGTQRQILRSLNEAARTLGEFLDIHICLSSTSLRPRWQPERVSIAPRIGLPRSAAPILYVW